LQQYISINCPLNELVLNFSQEEKERFWQNILNIAETPAKRYSHYNIISHSCTFLPLHLLEQMPSIKFPDLSSIGSNSLESISSPYLVSRPYLYFLCRLSFGVNVRRHLSERETVFLPAYFEKLLSKATITDSIGNTFPLIADSRYVVPLEKAPIVKPPFITPLFCGWMLYGIVMLLCIVEYRRKSLLRWLDAVLLGIMGVAGIYVFYLVCISREWYFCPSWWILWTHPIHLLGAFWSAGKCFDKWATYYHIFNLCALIIMLTGLCVIPQHFNPAFTPLIALLALRSIIRIYNYFKKYLYS
jgi:hypothetical protein